MNKNETTPFEPIETTQTPKSAVEKPHCKTLRNQFPFMWKICITYGICYLLFSYQNNDGIGSGIFAAISSIFLLAVASRLKKNPAGEETLSIHISPECVFYYLAATLISFGNCITDNGFFLFFNHVGSFLLFCIASIKLFYRDKQWGFGKYTCVLFCFWMQILEALPVPFSDFGAHQKTAKQKMPDSIRYVILGVLCGLPILVVTTLLLVSADQVFSNVLESIFDLDAFADWFFGSFMENIFVLPFCFLFYTLLLYLLFASLCKKGFDESVNTPKKHGSLIAITMFTMIDVVYVLFSGIQFVCLFIGVMPNEAYEYSEYAREGFFELLFVALINFFLVLFCNRHFVKNGMLKITMTITCICTFVMIASSAYRMWMYVDVYHLTFLRVFVLWFLAMLCFFMAGSLLSIYKEHWNTFRYCLFVLTCFYTAFALSNIDGQIAKYNVAQFERDLPDLVRSYGTDLTKNRYEEPLSVDVGYTEYFANEVPLLANYLPNDYDNSMAYAPILNDLYLQYGIALGSQNVNAIKDYLNTQNFFYTYTSSWDADYGTYGQELEKDAAIYDADLANSIFDWKHFNFIEYKCYQLCKQWETQSGDTIIHE